MHRLVVQYGVLQDGHIQDDHVVIQYHDGVNPFGTTNSSFSAQDEETLHYPTWLPKRKSAESASQSDFDEQDEELIDPISGKPSKTQFGISLSGLADAPQVPGWSPAGLNEGSRPYNMKLENMIQSIRMTKSKGIVSPFGYSYEVPEEGYEDPDYESEESASESEPESEPESESLSQTKYPNTYPNWHMEFWGTLSFYLPDGFSISQREMALQAELLQAENRIVFVFMRIVSTQGLQVAGFHPQEYWFNQIMQVAGQSGGQINLPNPSVMGLKVAFGNAAFYEPAIRLVAYDRQDAVVSVDRVGADSLLRDIAEAISGVLRYDPYYQSQNPIGVMNWLRTSVKPLFYAIQRTGPGFSLNGSVLPEKFHPIDWAAKDVPSVGYLDHSPSQGAQYRPGRDSI